MKKDITFNYYSVQGWMVKDLNLKGKELAVFAIIYGFSQDNETWFTGSLNYLCEWLTCSRQTAIDSLKKLINKNLLIKESYFINNIRFVKYKINLSYILKMRNL